MKILVETPLICKNADDFPEIEKITKQDSVVWVWYDNTLFFFNFWNELGEITDGFDIFHVSQAFRFGLNKSMNKHGLRLLRLRDECKMIVGLSEVYPVLGEYEFILTPGILHLNLHRMAFIGDYRVTALTHPLLLNISNEDKKEILTVLSELVSEAFQHIIEAGLFKLWNGQ